MTLRKWLKRAGLWTLVCALLGGCVPRARESVSVSEIRLPEPAEEGENMILGEAVASPPVDVTLVFAAQDGTSFASVTRSVPREAGQSLPQAALAALMSAGGERNLRAFGDTRVLACEYACQTATVNLSLDARNVQSPQELLALQASIGNTLLELEGVRAVNVLIGGLSEGYCQLPLGAQTEPLASVAAAYAQLQAERERLLQGEPSESVTRWALLYFPTSHGDWLIPEPRSLSVSGGDFVSALVSALKAGPRRLTSAIPAIPEGVELLDERPEIQTLSSGQRVLDLNFASTLSNYLAFSGLPVWKLAGALCMTMCSFLPELDGLRLLVDGEPVTMCERGGRVLEFDGGLIRRRDFSDCVGSTATLYLVNNEGMLQPVQRAMSMRSALSPKNLLTELINCGDIGALRFPVPQGVTPVDVLGVQVSGGVARVNLSGNFYRCCQTLAAPQERSLIYAMVNTLCQLGDIRGVRFYVEGRAAETLAGGIYLRSVLLPNPGIVVQRQ